MSLSTSAGHTILLFRRCLGRSSSRRYSRTVCAALVSRQQQSPLSPRVSSSRRAFSSRRYVEDNENDCEKSASNLFMWGVDPASSSSTNHPLLVDYRTICEDKDAKLTKVVCGATDTAFLFSNGQCYVSGLNKNGQLGLGHKQPVLHPTLLEIRDPDTNNNTAVLPIVDASLGPNHAAFVVESKHKYKGPILNVGSSSKRSSSSSSSNLYYRDLYTCGFGGSAFSGMGALGLGTTSIDALTPTRVQSLVEDGCSVRQVQVGESHTTVLTVEGEVLTTGAGSYGRLGNFETKDQLYFEPTEVFTPASSGITQIAGGKSFTLALSEKDGGIVYSWGRNHKGQLGTGFGLAVDMYAMQSVPEPIEEGELSGRTVTQIAAGHSHAACITSDGELFHWGMSVHLEPVKVMELLHTEIVHVACGENYTVAVDKDGHLYSWGKEKKVDKFFNGSGVLGQGPSVTKSNQFALVSNFSLGGEQQAEEDQQQKYKVQNISAGWQHVACIVKEE